MNSRMNFGSGFSIPQDNDKQNRGHQIPLTPEKPIAWRSSSIPIERLGNQIGGNQLGMENWKELIGFYFGVLQENWGHQMPLTPEKSIASRSSSIPVERQGNQIGGNQLGMENWKDLLGFYSWFIQENRGHQMPLTLEKPIASRSSSIPVERQGNQIGVNKLGMENWKDLIGFYFGVLQETTDCLNFNPIGFNSCTGGSYSSDFNPNVAWNNCIFAEVTRIKKALSMASANSMPSKRIRVMSTQSIPNLHSQACSNWAYSNHQNCPPNSNSRINGESMSYMPKSERFSLFMLIATAILVYGFLFWVVRNICAHLFFLHVGRKRRRILNALVNN